MSFDSSFQSDLFQAVIRNDIETVKLLISSCRCHIDLNGRNSVYRTPLSIAIENGNKLLVKLLLASGANIDAVSYSQTSCAYESPLTTATRVHNLELIELLLSYIENIVDDDDTGKTAVHWAASKGDITLAVKLASKGADINCFGPHRHTALHYAAISDKTDMAAWLLQNGAQVVLNDEGRSALHIAAVRGNIDMVCHLLKAGCTTVSRDNFNFSPLSLACLRGHLPVVSRLVESEMDIDVNDGLRRAAESGHTDVAQYLLSQPKCRIDSVNEHGESALYLAASRGHFQMLVLLINSNAQLDNADFRGNTPLIAALTREHVEASTTLIIHGALTISSAKTHENVLQMALNRANPIVLKYLVLAGCKMSSGCCLTPDLIAAHVREMDFTISAPMRFVWETRILLEAWSWLENHIMQPPSLKQISRAVIRQQLSVGCNGCSIVRHISDLPLPPALQCYLSFDNILNE